MLPVTVSDSPTLPEDAFALDTPNSCCRVGCGMEVLLLTTMAIERDSTSSDVRGAYRGRIIIVGSVLGLQITSQSLNRNRQHYR